MACLSLIDGLIRPRPVGSKPTVVYDTIEHVITRYKQDIRVVEVHDTITVIDTVEVIRDYFTAYETSRIFEDDSLRITVIDTVYKNRIANGSVKYQIKFPVEHNTVVERKIGIGVSAFIGKNTGIAPMLYYENYSIGYDVVNKNIVLGYIRYF